MNWLILFLTFVYDILYFCKRIFLFGRFAWFSFEILTVLQSASLYLITFHLYDENTFFYFLSDGNQKLSCQLKFPYSKKRATSAMKQIKISLSSLYDCQFSNAVIWDMIGGFIHLFCRLWPTCPDEFALPPPPPGVSLQLLSASQAAIDAIPYTRKPNGLFISSSVFLFFSLIAKLIPICMPQQGARLSCLLLLFFFLYNCGILNYETQRNNSPGKLRYYDIKIPEKQGCNGMFILMIFFCKFCCSSHAFSLFTGNGNEIFLSYLFIMVLLFENYQQTCCFLQKLSLLQLSSFSEKKWCFLSWRIKMLIYFVSEGSFPIELHSVNKDHAFLGTDSLRALYRRLDTLNRCAIMKIDNVIMRRRVSFSILSKCQKCHSDFSRISSTWNRWFQIL